VVVAVRVAQMVAWCCSAKIAGHRTPSEPG